MHVFHPRKFGGFKQKTYPRWVKKIIAKHLATARTKNPLLKLCIQWLCHSGLSTFSGFFLGNS